MRAPRPSSPGFANRCLAAELVLRDTPVRPHAYLIRRNAKLGTSPPRPVRNGRSGGVTVCARRSRNTRKPGGRIYSTVPADLECVVHLPVHVAGRRGQPDAVGREPKLANTPPKVLPTDSVVALLAAQRHRRRGEQSQDDTAGLILAEDDDWQQKYAPGKAQAQAPRRLREGVHLMTGFGRRRRRGARGRAAARWVYRDTGSVFLRRRSADVA